MEKPLVLLEEGRRSVQDDAKLQVFFKFQWLASKNIWPLLRPDYFWAAKKNQSELLWCQLGIP